MSGGNWKEMLLAAQSGDLNLVVYHIRTGANPNYQHPEFMTTPLMESLRNGHLEIAEFLLHNGADPFVKEDSGPDTAFTVAEASKNQEAIALLKNFVAKQKG